MLNPKTKDVSKSEDSPTERPRSEGKDASKSLKVSSLNVSASVNDNSAPTSTDKVSKYRMNLFNLINYIIQCLKCFVSHFPRPNTKLCKYRKIKRIPVRYRLRGGAKDQGKGHWKHYSRINICNFKDKTRTL